MSGCKVTTEGEGEQPTITTGSFYVTATSDYHENARLGVCVNPSHHLGRVSRRLGSAQFFPLGLYPPVQGWHPEDE